MKPVISVEGLGKKYLIKRKHSLSGYRSLREELFRFPQKLFSKGEIAEEYWALNNVSFDVMPGERIGIIGRNGAGKSTLLKLLSRITSPTRGKITMRGRVASLLEVGTGFHPELTGRENIYLNGAILGMPRSEICKKFDEIVDFAGVEKFLDTPVKRYSSGMYVRLAFSVAAHLEPEILIVDEVLAVGDAEFQKKCLGKMEEVSKEAGRTVMFVSHNMEAIKKLCSHVILLQQGELVESSSDLSSIIRQYLSPEEKIAKWVGSESVSNLVVKEFGVVTEKNVILNRPVRVDEDFYVYVKFDLEVVDSSLDFGIKVHTVDGDCLFWAFSMDAHEETWPKFNVGENYLRVKIPKFFLNEGEYFVELLASINNTNWLLAPDASPVAFSLEVEGGFSSSPVWLQPRPGMLAPVCKWESL